MVLEKRVNMYFNDEVDVNERKTRGYMFSKCSQPTVLRSLKSPNIDHYRSFLSQSTQYMPNLMFYKIVMLQLGCLGAGGCEETHPGSCGVEVLKRSRQHLVFFLSTLPRIFSREKVVKIVSARKSMTRVVNLKGDG